MSSTLTVVLVSVGVSLAMNGLAYGTYFLGRFIYRLICTEIFIRYMCNNILRGYKIYCKNNEKEMVMNALCGKECFYEHREKWDKMKKQKVYREYSIIFWDKSIKTIVKRLKNIGIRTKLMHDLFYFDNDFRNEELVMRFYINGSDLNE